MILLFTAALFGGIIKRPDVIKWMIANVPVFFYSDVVFIGLGWIVTAGLFLGRDWARYVCAFTAVVFLMADYFFAVSMLSRPLGTPDSDLVVLSLRLSVVFEVMIVPWGLTLLYLAFSYRPAEPAVSSLSVEVLNTK
jgi:hypothetical protein